MLVESRPSTVIASVIDPVNFDWKAYELNYTGRALISRLLFIPKLLLREQSSSSSPTPSPMNPRAIALCRAAIQRALPVIKADTWDHEGYLNALHWYTLTLSDNGGFRDQLSSIGSSSSPLSSTPISPSAVTRDEPMDVDGRPSRGRSPESEGKPDMRWVDDVRASERAERGKLAVELSGYMSNLIKESIRLTHFAIAAVSIKSGDLKAALKSYSNAREYSSGSAHSIELGMSNIIAGLLFCAATPSAGNVLKVESSLDRHHPPVPASAVPTSSTMTQMDVRLHQERQAQTQAVRREVTVKLRVARGLLALQNSEYERAGRELGEIGEEGGLSADWEGKIVSSSDMAFVTAFCVLASGSRSHIRRVLLDRTSFRTNVPDSHRWVLDLIRAFVDAKYADVMSLLSFAEAYILLHPWLSTHTSTLLGQIKTRAIIQYLEPFSSVRIAAMAAAFSLEESVMLSKVCELAESGQIDAKIDLIDNVVTLTSPDHRNEVFKKTLEVGAEANYMTYAVLFRMRLIEAGIIVDPHHDDHPSPDARMPLGAAAPDTKGKGRLPRPTTEPFLAALD